jgi:hypothetical protein
MHVLSRIETMAQHISNIVYTAHGRVMSVGVQILYDENDAARQLQADTGVADAVRKSPRTCDWDGLPDAKFGRTGCDVPR